MPAPRRIRRKRLIAGAIVALALAPGTFVRAPLPTCETDRIAITEVTDVPDIAKFDGFVREGVWELASPDMQFGGFSALVLDGEAGLIAYSDRGVVMRFARPGGAGAGNARLEPLGDRGALNRTLPDVESATRAGASGDIWLGYEAGNAVIRYDPTGRLEASRQPPEWSDWPGNSGPEAIARLPDGRFIVLPERSPVGVLHPGDPTRDEDARTFRYSLPGDYVPTDMAALPDGRVLVLMRHLSFAFPPFAAALGIADPRDIDATGGLEVDRLLNLDRLVPGENYEGLAVEPAEDGATTIWIIADDNIASFQRSLLVRLRWKAEA